MPPQSLRIRKVQSGKKDISLPVSFSTTTSSIDSKYWLQSTGEKSRFLPGLQDKKKSVRKKYFKNLSFKLAYRHHYVHGREHAGVTQQFRTGSKRRMNEIPIRLQY